MSNKNFQKRKTACCWQKAFKSGSLASYAKKDHGRFSKNKSLRNEAVRKKGILKLSYNTCLLNLLAAPLFKIARHHKHFRTSLKVWLCKPSVQLVFVRVEEKLFYLLGNNFEERFWRKCFRLWILFTRYRYKTFYEVAHIGINSDFEMRDSASPFWNDWNDALKQYQTISSTYVSNFSPALFLRLINLMAATL